MQADRQRIEAPIGGVAQPAEAPSGLDIREAEVAPPSAAQDMARQSHVQSGPECIDAPIGGVAQLAEAPPGFEEVVPPSDAQDMAGQGHVQPDPRRRRRVVTIVVQQS